MGSHRFSLDDAELAAVAEALREAAAAELLTPQSRAVAGALLERVDRRLPSATARHPAGSVTGRVIAGDEILRLLLDGEDRHGSAALSNEQIGAQLTWKPPGTSVRELLEELRRTGWVTATRDGSVWRYALTRKGRGRARELRHASGAPDSEARVDTPDELLDVIYADATPCPTSVDDDAPQRIVAIWHRPTVQAAGRLTQPRLAVLDATLRDRDLVAERIGSYGTLTLLGERAGRERWQAARPLGALGGPPRPTRPHRAAPRVVVLTRDRGCPNCGAFASWLTRRRGRRYEQLRGRGEADFICLGCDARWTIYLEATRRDGTFDPVGDSIVCRPRWRYRVGWLYVDALAPPDHHPTLTDT